MDWAAYGRSCSLSELVRETRSPRGVGWLEIESTFADDDAVV
jgi:hypothetical protein